MAEQTIFLLRHAKAAMHEMDFMRPLTESGVREASVRREKLGNPSFDLVIASPAERAVDTAALVGGIPPIEVLRVWELYPDARTTLGINFQAACNRLGERPVVEYLAEEKEGTAIIQHGHLSWMALQATFETRPKARKILVVAHSVLLPSIGMAACTEGRHGDQLKAINPGPCQGFVLTFDDGGKVHLGHLIED